MPQPLTVSHRDENQPLVAPGFDPVAAAFFRAVGGGKRAGASLAIWHNGVPVVELSTGTADDRQGREFNADTLSNVFSCTKGMASLLVAMLVEEGKLPAYDTPIAEIWPEFSPHGKDRILIGDALAHRAGVSEPRRELTPEQILDPLKMADILATQEPFWEPGHSHQYHGITHGAITAKLVSIATGRDIGTEFANRIAKPLKADAWIGLPRSEHSRVAKLLPDPKESPGSRDAAATASGAVPIDYLSGERWIEPQVREAQIPGAGGIATASGLARIWSAAVTPTRGVSLLGEEAGGRLRRVRSAGPSFVAAPPPYQSWGAGVMVPSDWEPYMSPDSFGHDGAGGQVAFADPRFRIGFGFVTNQMGDWRRGQSIIAALGHVLR